ncbi:MAG: carbohydrate kinase [Clostridiales bacterium]|nr:carbohydrate kinase [Clostridiales bacterium]
MKYLLGIDSGGTFTKAGLYDVEGREIATAQESIDVIFPAEGMNERDAGQLKQATYRVIKQVLGQSDIDSKDIAGISPTGQGNGLYLFDKNGGPAHNPIMSGDIRAKEYVKKWKADGLVESVFMPKTFQDIWSGQPVALLAWLRDHDPQALERSAYAVTCKDYLRYLLTGEFFTEITESTGWSLMDIRKGDYDDELFESVGLAPYRHLFPPVRQSAEICGTVTRQAAEITGLAEGTPVMGGMFDIAACPLGTGVLDSSKMGVVAGSWSINGYIDKQPSSDIMLSIRYFDPDYYFLSENSATSATNLEWFVNRLMHKEREEATATGRNIYESANTMVGSVSTHDCSLLFLPFLFGTNASIDAKSAFIGLSGIHTREHMLRAVYEGVVFSHQYHLEKLYKVKPKHTFDAIRISGGATRSALWVQMFADITGLPIDVSASEELGILGSAICAGIGSGLYNDAKEAAGKFVKIEKTIYPDKNMTGFYSEKYALYKKVLASLDSVWPEFGSLFSVDKA